MLEKKPGVIHVDKPRAILLMEADFNFMNELVFGKRMIQWATEWKMIFPKCFSSHNNRSAQDLLIRRKCIVNVSRMQRTPLAMASVDTAQCYDCIQHTVGSICVPEVGSPC